MINDYKPNEKGARKVVAFKEAINSIIEMYGDAMDEGRHKSLFLTKLEEASMFGTKAVLQKEGHNIGVVKY